MHRTDSYPAFAGMCLCQSWSPRFFPHTSTPSTAQTSQLYRRPTLRDKAWVSDHSKTCPVTGKLDAAGHVQVFRMVPPHGCLTTPRPLMLGLKPLSPASLYMFHRRAYHVAPAAINKHQSSSTKLYKALQFRFCEVCGTSSGVLPCFACQGSGEVTTQPGGAGRPFYVGEARCRHCNGLGQVACPMCAGWERPMDTEQARPPELNSLADEVDDLAWLDGL